MKHALLRPRSQALFPLPLTAREGKGERAWDEVSFGQSKQRCLNVDAPTCDGFSCAWQLPREFKLLWLVYFTMVFCGNICSKITLPTEFSTCKGTCRVFVNYLTSARYTSAINWKAFNSQTCNRRGEQNTNKTRHSIAHVKTVKQPLIETWNRTCIKVLPSHKEWTWFTQVWKDIDITKFSDE